MQINGTAELRQTTTPAVATVGYDKLYSKTGDKLALLQSDGIEQHIMQSAYGDIFENNTAGTALILVAANTYYGWLTAGANLHFLTAFTDNAAGDRITISAGGDGVYSVSAYTNCTLSGGGSIFRAAIFKNGVATNILHHKATTLANMTMNLSGLIDLVAGDYLDLRFLCGNNNRTLTLYTTRLTAQRVFR